MNNPFDLNDRTIVVTGASSGIGRETAIGLSRLGARVVLIARNRERLEKTHQLLQGTGHGIEVYDLSAYEGIPIWLRGLADVHGPFDGLVHSAGFQITAPLKTLEANNVEQLWRINVSASLWLAKAYRQRGVNKAGGSIVLLASAMGLVGSTALSAYSASKGAVIAMTRSLAMELAREQIRINCVAPGLIKTEMFQELTQQLTVENLAALEREYPLGFGEPTDVVSAIAFLLSGGARWITGSTLVVDGGYTAH